MTNPSKAFRRLGMVGAAAVVGLVPVALSGGSAFAVTNATLSVSPNTVGSTSQVIDSFTTTQALVSGNTITATSLASSGCPIGLPENSADYTVTFTAPGATSPTTATGTATPSTAQAACSGTNYVSGSTDYSTVSFATTTAIPSGSKVTITVNGAQNPSTPSSVYFNDATSAEPTPLSTNPVSITSATVSTPGVNSVNPTAYHAASGEPFTVTGTNFSTAYSATNATPVVCFVESTTTAPPVSSSSPATNPCAGPVTGAVGTPQAGVITSAPATVTAASPGEIQGTSPALTAGHSYNVVVYNYNGGAATPTYTAASGTTSQTLVGVSTTGLDVVPEAGVRVVDSRSGLNVAQGTLPTGTPTAIPLSKFAQSLALPSNLPTSYTGLDLNVTAVAPASGGNIQMWAASGTCVNGLTAPIKPATVNFQPPQDTNNSQLIPIAPASVGPPPVPANNELCVQDNGAPVNLVVDVVGYTTAPYTLVNSRVLDTRPASQSGSLLGPLQSNTVYRAQVCGSGSLPACPTSTQLVAFNIADVAPSAPGNLRAFAEPATGAPTAAGVPNTAVDNYIVNTDASAMLITTINVVGGVGYLDLYSAMNGPGTVNVVIDHLATYGGSSLTSLAQPTRVYDSRPGPIPAAGTVTVVGAPSGSGSSFVPAGALGLVGNLSDINPAGQGYLVTFPAGGAVPGTASIANFPLQTRNTNNMVALNPSNESFSIYAGGAATNTTYDASAYIK